MAFLLVHNCVEAFLFCWLPDAPDLGTRCSNVVSLYYALWKALINQEVLPPARVVSCRTCAGRDSNLDSKVATRLMREAVQ